MIKIMSNPIAPFCFISIELNPPSQIRAISL
nr:MAG TPA: hypothetical protein [Herelleviridae sp.]